MTTTILAIIGTVTGCTALLIQLLSFLADRPHLEVTFSLTLCSSEQHPMEHFRLTLVFKNKGRRPVRILEAGLEVPIKSIVLRGQKYEAQRIVQNLYNARKQPMIVLEENGRQELVFEPFDVVYLRHLAGKKANGFVVDSLDRRYNAFFDVPVKSLFERVDKAKESSNNTDAGDVQ